MFSLLFFPAFTWFFYLCSLLIAGYTQHTNNLWYVLLIIPVGFIDNLMFRYYYDEEDDE